MIMPTFLKIIIFITPNLLRYLPQHKKTTWWNIGLKFVLDFMNCWLQGGDLRTVI